MADWVEIVKEVRSVIYPSYLVGGAVRDITQGVTPKDYDFCTPLLPPEVEALIESAGRKVYHVGDKHGTLGMRVDGQQVEITTFRTEKYTPGSRHPEVSFAATLEDDLARRDFTINAMAMDADTLAVHDPQGGIDDLMDGVLRAVGNARQRFKEDPLRLLRLCRFAAKLDFNVHGETTAAAARCAPSIVNVSRNRWVPELDAILMCDQPSIGLMMAQSIGILKFILPEVSIQAGYDQQTPYHSKTLWGHTMAVVEAAATHGSPELRWAALLHDVGKPFVAREKNKTFLRDGVEVMQKNYIDHAIVGAEIVQGIAVRLHWSKLRGDVVYNLVLNHLNEDSPLREYDSKAR